MRHLKKWKALLLAGVMTLTACLGGTAMAADQESAAVLVNKTLEVAEGTTLPDLTFQFTITKVTDDAPDASVQDGITFTDADLTAERLSNGVYTVEKSKAITFGTFPHAGEYVYTVSETNSNAEGVTYAENSYQLHVYVYNGTDGSLYVNSSVAYPVTSDGGVGEKADGLDFINQYVGTLTEEDNTALVISKDVTGDLANLDTEFTYTIRITLPSTVTGISSVTGSFSSGGTQQFAVNQDVTFTLKDGESLTFDGIPAGTRYVVTEAGTSGFTPSVVVMEDGTRTTNTSAGEGQSLATASQGSTNLAGDNGENSASFTNNWDDTPATGIIINNLPLIAVAVAAVLAAVVLFAVNRRRRSF